MNKYLLFFVLLILIMSNYSVVNADENHHSDSIQDENHINSPSETNLQKSRDDPKKMEPSSKNDALKESHSNQHNGGVEGAHQEDGHSDAIYNESSANLKVLSLFGLVNMSFILFGLWNKWIKRQEA